MSNKQILLLNGPNLNLLGSRNKDLYGAETLAAIESRLSEQAIRKGYTLKTFQSNSEGALIDAIHEAVKSSQAIIINPGAYSHTSVALRDALECFPGPVLEVHLSNIYRRETFRQHSYVSPVATGVICGLGPLGYELALEAVVARLELAS